MYKYYNLIFHYEFSLSLNIKQNFGRGSTYRYTEI